MPTVDRWVVHRACELLGEHSAAVGEDIARFAINLSGQSLQDESFLEFVVDEIKDERLPPGVLCFELTETATIGNLEGAELHAHAARSRVASSRSTISAPGVSSLAYLKDLSVNYLKIDGSFVRDALTNARSESMIKAIAQLAKVMCMETIAEYVETDVLRARMADLGVDYGQGFAMGKAQPLEELLRELAIYEATVSRPSVRRRGWFSRRTSGRVLLDSSRPRPTPGRGLCPLVRLLESGRMAIGRLR
jgi:EAL domain-containing protein (putative c-di-GMP-specific phosphodiesterase class I)